MTAPIASGGSEFAGWALHPLESDALPRRTPDKDLANANNDWATVTDLVRSIANQAALRSELTPFVDRRNAMALRKRYELMASAVEECVAADDERASMQLNEGGKCGFKIV